MKDINGLSAEFISSNDLVLWDKPAKWFQIFSFVLLSIGVGSFVMAGASLNAKDLNCWDSLMVVHPLLKPDMKAQARWEQQKSNGSPSTQSKF